MMNTSMRATRLAFGLGALTLAALPAVALAQPYDQGGYSSQDSYYQQRRDYDAQYGPGAYDRYMADHQRSREACHDQKQGNEVVGGVLGGIAGAVIGSNVARGGGREGGAVIGGVGGAVAGSQIAKGATNCERGG
ncbi:MAG TPA: glycine zipper 2TM domain-containing protein [Caulobacteraceae bacterium]|nr:glycine zipper 2TM domain-containing protein [Caulobacteraceae bacterium]